MSNKNNLASVIFIRIGLTLVYLQMTSSLYET